MIQELSIKTGGGTDLVEITEQVQSLVGRTGVKNGACIVSTTHTTAAVLVNENEPGYRHDLVHFLDRLIPVEGDYRHPDGNAHAHIKASLIGSEKHFAVQDGRLVLGTWQAIFLIEFDGPRTRRVVVKVMEG